MKKTNTKLLAVLMTLALLISAVCFMTAAADPTSAALGYSASRVVKKDTTGIPDIKDYTNNNTAKEFVVSDITGLETIAFYVNDGTTTFEGVTFYQTADIQPSEAKSFGGIGKNATVIFAGTYDGQGYVINNLTVSAGEPCGIFKTTCGTLRNIVIGENVVVNGPKSKTGGLVGEVRTAGTTVIDNCYVAATVTSAAALNGGIVGQADYEATKSENAKLEMKNCTFAGSLVSANGRCGGLLGRAAAIALEIDNCVNAGSVSTGTADAPAQVAEIANAETGDIKKVSAAGGFVGETTKGADKILIKNSVNIGNITSGYSAAAFIGSLPANAGATVQNCTNYGTVTNKTASGTGVKVGETDVLMKYHSTLAGYIFNTGAVLTIGEDSKDLKGQTAPTFEKVTMPEVTTPEETTPEETTTEEATTPEETTTEEVTTAKKDTETTKAPAETDDKTTTDKGGCGSIVSGSVALIVSIACGAMMIVRKKED